MRLLLSEYGSRLRGTSRCKLRVQDVLWMQMLNAHMTQMCLFLGSVRASPCAPSPSPLRLMRLESKQTRPQFLRGLPFTRSFCYFGFYHKARFYQHREKCAQLAPNRTQAPMSRSLQVSTPYCKEDERPALSPLTKSAQDSPI